MKMAKQVYNREWFAKTVAKALSPGRVQHQPKGDKRATVRAVAAGGVVDELRQAIAQAEKAGMSRATMASIAGMPRAMVYRVADGKMTPSINTIQRILAAIGLQLRIVSRVIQ